MFGMLYRDVFYSYCPGVIYSYKENKCYVYFQCFSLKLIVGILEKGSSFLNILSPASFTSVFV